MYGLNNCSQRFFHCFKCDNIGKITLIIQAALSLISAIGLALAILSICSYLPPWGGYFGATLAISSLIAMAILQVASLAFFSKIFLQSSSGSFSLSSNSARWRKISLPLTFSSYESSVTSSSYENSSTSIDEDMEQPCPKNLPDEIYYLIFSYLDYCSLINATKVCRKWSVVAEDQNLWKKHCLEQTIIPPDEEQVNWNRLFQESKNLTHLISTSNVEPRFVKFSEPIQSFLITHNQFFISFIDRIEAWNLELTHQIHVYWFHSSIYDNYLKIWGNTINCIGQNNSEDYIPCLVQVDLKNNEISEIYTFVYTPSSKCAALLYYTSFKHFLIVEASNNHAFVGLEDGSIDVWNLKDQFNYFLGHEEQEKTYHDKDISSDKSLNLTTNYEKYCEFASRQPILKGHSNKIFFLHVANNYLFSGSFDYTIKKWDLATFSCIQTVRTGSCTIISLLNNNFLVRSGYDMKILNQNLETILCTTKQADTRLSRQCLLAGNLLFYTCLWGYKEEDIEKIKVFDLHSKQIKTFSHSKRGRFNNIRLINNQLVCACRNSLMILELKSNKKTNA